MHASFVDITGRQFGRLTAQWPSCKTKNQQTIWLCLCECGSLVRARLDGLRKGRVKSCGCKKSEHGIKHGKSNTPEYKIWNSAKKRARQKKVPFSISLEDVVIPDVCPLLGVPFKYGVGKGHATPQSASLDKIIPALGYVKGNVWVVSKKANMMKSNSTLDEFELVAKNWRQRAG